MGKLVLTVAVLGAVTLAGFTVARPARQANRAGGADPGTIVVVGEEPVALAFTLGTGVSYQFASPTGMVTIWDSPERTNQILPGVTFTSAGTRLFGDVTGDGSVDLTDLIVVRNDLGSTILGTDLDDSGLVDSADLVLDRGALDTGPSTTCVTVYAEGLSASTALGDTQVELLTDADEDGSFTSHQSQSLTVVSIDVTPSAGPSGTPVVIALTPAIPPLSFDATTTVSWSGQFDPLAGAPAPPFHIDYSSAQVHEQSGAEAIIVVGDGTSSNIPDATTFGTTGRVPGVVTLDVGGHLLGKTFVYHFQLSGEWRQIAFDNDASRSVGEIPGTMPIYVINPANPDFSLAELLHALWYYRIFVLRVQENPTTQTTAPTTLEIVLVTVDSSGVLVDSVPTTLFRVAGEDGDPDNFVYHSDLDKPVVFVDSAVNKDDFPELTILKAASSGHAIAIP